MTEHKYAGFWIRVWAAIIDSILIAAITVPLLFAIYGDEYLDNDSFVQGGWDVVISYLLPAVVVIIFWVYRSATPGKMIAKLAIVDANTGEHPTTGQFIGRYLGYYVSMIPLFLGILWVGFDKRKQGWHDKLAGTVVIRTNRYVDEPSEEFDIET
ncbi:MAG: RDD family protein [Pseudomonadales bacterium]|nr:RDD family protein [Pseudomonadales bacterium]